MLIESYVMRAFFPLPFTGMAECVSALWAVPALCCALSLMSVSDAAVRRLEGRGVGERKEGRKEADPDKSRLWARCGPDAAAVWGGCLRSSDGGEGSGQALAQTMNRWSLQYTDPEADRPLTNDPQGFHEFMVWPGKLEWMCSV